MTGSSAPGRRPGTLDTRDGCSLRTYELYARSRRTRALRWDTWSRRTLSSNGTFKRTRAAGALFSSCTPTRGCPVWFAYGWESDGGRLVRRISKPISTRKPSPEDGELLG
jgi:hypothetical protein